MGVGANKNFRLFRLILSLNFEPEMTILVILNMAEGSRLHLFVPTPKMSKIVKIGPKMRLNQFVF